MANFNLSTTVSGIGTFTIGTAPTTDYYIIQGTVDLPTIQNGSSGPSAIVVLVKKNASTIYTSTAGDRGFRVGSSFTAGDTLSIVTSSANSVDNQLNAVRTTVLMWEGGQ